MGSHQRHAPLYPTRAYPARPQPAQQGRPAAQNAHPQAREWQEAWARTAHPSPSPTASLGLPGQVRYVDPYHQTVGQHIQTLGGASQTRRAPGPPTGHTAIAPAPAPAPAPAHMHMHVPATHPLSIPRTTRESLVRSLMRVHANEVYNADALLVDGFGGGCVGRSSSVISPASSGAGSGSGSARSSSSSGAGMGGDLEARHDRDRARERERGADPRADAALDRAFESWHRVSGGTATTAAASAALSSSSLDGSYLRGSNCSRPTSRIAERRRRLSRPAAVATRPGAGRMPSEVPPPLPQCLSPSVYSEDAMTEKNGAYSPSVPLSGKEYGTYDTAYPRYADSPDELDYDYDSLPPEFLERIPPDVTVAQAIQFAVQNGLVPPDFGLRAEARPTSGSARSDEEMVDENGDEEREYDLENLPEAFVSRIPPGVTRLQAVKYAVRNGLVPADFGKRSKDGRPLGPLGFVLPKGMTKAEVVAMALQNGIHPPGLAIDTANVVTWSGPLSPSNPRNWPARKKWGTTVAVSLSTFVSNMASSMVTPLIPLLREQLQGLSKAEVERNSIDFESSLVLSCYILAFAFAPFLYGPTSELFGRRRLLQVGILIFFTFHLLCAMATSLPTLVALRFFAALGAAAPMAVGGACVTDMFTPQQRARPLLWFGLAPLLGPVLGPVLSGALVEAYDRWQPVFWVSAGVVGAVGLVLLFLPESYVPTVLERKAERLRKETSNEDLVTVFDLQLESLTHRVGRYLLRPLVLLFTEPIMVLLALLTAVSFGQVYLLFAVLPGVHTRYYHESPVVGSLHFLSFGLGFVGGALLGLGAIDRIHTALVGRYGGVPHPEYKLVLMAALSPLAPLALTLFGWATEKELHWIVGDLATFWFALCVSASFLSVQAYLVDTFALLAGSALTATIVTRSLLGFVFTLFTAVLVQDIRLGYAFTLMGAISALVGLPVSVVLMRYGARLRERSAYARG